ncbi:MAG: efflux RND transporter periplasmic adaptor subunit [Myxococcota bacterium]
MRLYPIAVPVLLACAGLPEKLTGGDAHEHGEAGHDDGHGGGDHGHDAPAAGGGHVAEEEDPRPGIAVTVYQGPLELFMEYPAFVVGQDSPLVAHFTETSDPNAYRWVTTGKVTATLKYAGGAEESFVADKLLRNGIFKPVAKPTRAGPARLVLSLAGEQVSGDVDVGDVVVHATVAEAVAAAPPEEEAPAVSWLKEQQWKTVYATAPAEAGTVRAGVRATAEIVPVAGRAAELSAPVAGRVVSAKVPWVGRPVRKGEVLAEVVPLAGDRGAAELELAAAKGELALAERAAQRAGELFPSVLSERERDAALADRDRARARVDAAEAQVAAWTGGRGSGVPLRSPIDGVVSFTAITPGQAVEAGARLVAVVDAAEVWLEAHVSESDAARVARSPGATFTVAGADRVFTSDATIAVGAALDPVTRTLPLVFAVPNPDGVLKPGMYARATVFTGERAEGVVVPASAVVDDGGAATVFVMDGGESFFQRRVVLGARDGDRVQVIDGVAPGERVVSAGAYEILLSTKSGAIPEHGHAH